MARDPKPWQRKSTGAWFIQLDGRKLYLGKDKKLAYDQYHRIMQRRKAPSNSTVREVLDAYWTWLKANRAPETVGPRAKILKSFGEHVPASLKAEAIRPHHVQAWIDKNARIKSPTTKNARITLIMGVFSWAKKMGYIETNPLADMPKPSALTRQEFVPADLWQRLLALATDEAFRDLLTVMLSTGCRVTEVMRFEAAHVNGQAITLPIVESKGRRKSRVSSSKSGLWIPFDAR